MSDHAPDRLELLDGFCFISSDAIVIHQAGEARYLAHEEVTATFLYPPAVEHGGAQLVLACTQEPDRHFLRFPPERLVPQYEKAQQLLLRHSYVTLHCPKCGYRLLQGQDRCPECGTAVNSMP